MTNNQLTFTTTNWGMAQTVTVEAGDDDNVDNESATLAHTAFGGDYVNVTKDLPVSITDDDDPAVTVSFGATNYTVAEGGTQSVTVTLSDDPERKLVIPITTTGQGGATSTDYSVPTSVMFNAGETSNAITFTATQDSEDDDGESVLLAFGTILPDRVIRGSVSTTTVSTTDDDTAGVTVMPTALTIEEGATSTYTVVLDSEPVGQVTVTISGHTGTDVLLNTTTLTFSSESWDTPQTVTAEQDGDAEDDIPVTLMHTVASTDQDYDEASVSSATVSITDDDDPVVSVSIESAANAVAEGATTTVTVTLSADPEREVVIPLTATGQGGATSTDYSGRAC